MSESRLTFHITKFEQQLVSTLLETFPGMNERQIVKLAMNYGLMQMMQSYSGLSKNTIVEETNANGVVIRKETTK